jgi:catechol 2,3-dioxygenase-like lactoylglutathione lyase family enzyme
VISGAHVVLFTPAAEATREFLRDALGFESVDAGGGWLIFALPPAEVAVHPAEVPSHELYLMCDDLAAAMARLTAAGAAFGPIHEERWGRIALMTIPGGAQLSVYQPSHPSPSHARPADPA